VRSIHLCYPCYPCFHCTSFISQSQDSWMFYLAWCVECTGAFPLSVHQRFWIARLFSPFFQDYLLSSIRPFSISKSIKLCFWDLQTWPYLWLWICYPELRSELLTFQENGMLYQYRSNQEIFIPFWCWRQVLSSPSQGAKTWSHCSSLFLMS